MRTSGTQPTDYVSIAIAYAEEAIAAPRGEWVGKWIRIAAQRFIRDLKRTQRKRPPFVWSAERANHACSFIEELPHVEGVWSTRTIRLEPFQIFLLVQLFGFRDHNGGRRFTTCLFAVARKNAKTTLAAAILLYCLCCEAEPGPQILAAAMTGNQARIVWSIAKRMVEATEDLREAFQLEAFANTIVRYENGGVCKPINAKASSQDGLNPSALCFDELHAHKTHDLLNVLTSAAGARANPLFLYTSTEGYETPGPWPEIRRFAQNVLEEAIEAEHFLAIYYALDDEDQDFDPSKWIKANPLLDANPILRAAIDKEAIEARAMAGKLSEFRIKRLNRQASSAGAWVNLVKWKRCAGAVNLEELRGLPCWAAFDLASTRDMNAWRLLWQKGDEYFTWGRYWVPTDAVAQRTERRSVPYRAWVDAGLITQTEGDAVDYSVIERDILADCKRFAPKMVAYDPWGATQLAQNLSAQGVPLMQFIQGPRSYNAAMDAFEVAYTTGKLHHGADPVLLWQAANLVARTDVNLNKAPDRKRSADKIDGIVALLMCFGLAAATKPKTEYRLLFVG